METALRTMRAAVPVAVTACSAMLGLAWHFVAVAAMQGRLSDALRPTWLAAGLTAGLVTGRFTIWSRRRCAGRESLGYGFATYYVGILVYWATFVVLERIAMCVRAGGWTDFDLRDHLVMIGPFLFLGTLWHGLILIPLAFASRFVLWRVHETCGGSRD